jgi:predicted nucleic acid-binding protein
MSANIFLDTNTLVYILQGNEPTPGVALTPSEMEANRKADITLGLLQGANILVGVQVFNEICNVALRRRFDWKKTRDMLATLEALCLDVVPLTLQVHKRGLALHDKYKLQFYDALMLAAALEGGCTMFYSEDMQDGQLIEKSMTIKNPFKA